MASPGVVHSCAHYMQLYAHDFLPSFLRPLVTEGQSNQTHPALLWLLRKHGSLRLKDRDHFHNVNYKKNFQFEIPLHFLFDTSLKGKQMGTAEVR